MNAKLKKLCQGAGLAADASDEDAQKFYDGLAADVNTMRTRILRELATVQEANEALAEHGVFLNTPVMIARRHGHVAHPLSSYPPHFQAAWRRQVAADPDDFAQLYAEYRTELEMNPADAEKRHGYADEFSIVLLDRPGRIKPMPSRYGASLLRSEIQS